jgi:SAM-dependent methyltransferase
VSGCSLTATETLLEIGFGMGGGTRIIIGKFGNYVTAYERNSILATAMRHAVTYDINDKLVVTTLPFEDLDFKPKYFRAALVHETLYTMEDKAGLISKISVSLKPGASHLVMTDSLFDADDESEELAAWKAVDEHAVHPWTEAEFTKAIERAGV